MELDGLGDRCSLPTCRKLDFLPLTCPHCTSVFCAAHYPHAAHSCPTPPPSTYIPTCPICARAVPRGDHPSLHHAMAAHIDRGCPARPRANARCEKPGCRARDVAPVTCRACGGTFCLQHRLEVDHECKHTGVAQDTGPAGALSLAAAMRRLATAQKEEEAKVAGKGGGGKGEKKKLSLRRVRSKSPNGGNAGSTGTAARPGTSTATPTSNPKTGLKVAPAPTATAPLGATSMVFSNVASSPRRAAGPSAAVASDDEMHLAVYFCAEARRRPEYWVVSRRWSAGKVLDAFKLPALANGQRYALYAVRKAGNSVAAVNLLPRITPLREHGREILADGDCVVVEVGEKGLRDGWMDVLGRDRALSKFKATRISSASSTAKCVLV